MAMLFVRCHECHESFASGIAHDPENRGSLELLNVLEKCPQCGSESRYSTHEFFFPSGEPQRADAPLDPSAPIPVAATAEESGSEEPEPPHDQGPPVGGRSRPVNVVP